METGDDEQIEKSRKGNPIPVGDDWIYPLWTQESEAPAKRK